MTSLALVLLLFGAQQADCRQDAMASATQAYSLSAQADQIAATIRFELALLCVSTPDAKRRQWLLDLGYLYVALDQKARAASTFDQAAMIDGPLGAHVWATRAYLALSLKQREQARRYFAQAVGLSDATEPHRSHWRQQLARLDHWDRTRGFSLTGYSVWRTPAINSTGVLAAEPLGGSQAGLAIHWQDPLSAAIIPDLTIRSLWAIDPINPDFTAADTQQLGIGLFWSINGDIPVRLGIERLVAAGAQARDSWLLSMGGGLNGTYPAPWPREAYEWAWSLYGNYSLIGFEARDWQASGVARYGIRPIELRPLTWGADVAVHLIAQHANGQTDHLMEIGAGPYLRLNAHRTAGHLAPLAMTLRLEGRTPLTSSAATRTGLVLSLEFSF